MRVQRLSLLVKTIPLLLFLDYMQLGNVLEVRSDFLLTSLMASVSVTALTGINGTERLIGNGLLQSIVFGTTAGRRASETTKHAASMNLGEWTPLRLRHRTKVPLSRRLSSKTNLPITLLRFLISLSLPILYRMPITKDTTLVTSQANSMNFVSNCPLPFRCWTILLGQLLL